MKKIIITAIFLSLFVQPVFAQTPAKTINRTNEQYQKAKSQYLQEVNFYKDTRTQFKGAVENFKAVKTPETRDALLDTSKNFIGKVISSLSGRLESIKSWVEDNGNISDPKKAEITAEINKDISWLRQRNGQVASSSLTAIKEESAMVSNYWKANRVRVKRFIGNILSARIENILTKAENFSDKVEAKIEELQTAGKDTAVLEEGLTEMERKLALSKEKIAAAETKFAQIKGEPGADTVTELTEANDLFNSGHTLLLEANKYAKEAYSDLKKIVEDMRAIMEN